MVRLVSIVTLAGLFALVSLVTIVMPTRLYDARSGLVMLRRLRGHVDGGAGVRRLVAGSSGHVIPSGL